MESRSFARALSTLSSEVCMAVFMAGGWRVCLSEVEGSVERGGKSDVCGAEDGRAQLGWET